MRRFGYSRAGYFFTGEPTPGTPAADVPGFLLGDQVGAVVVGGSAASNPQAQIGLAGSNNGSNLHVARNLYTYEDQVSLTHGVASVQFRRLVPAVPVERNAGAQPVRTSHVRQPANISGRHHQQLPLRSGADGDELALAVRRVLCAGYDSAEPTLTLSLGFRDEFSTGWNEAHGRAANYTFPDGVISSEPALPAAAFTVNNAKFLPQPRIGLAWSPFCRQDRSTRGLRHVQRSAGRARLPHGPERALQSHLQHRVAAGVATAHRPGAPVPAKALLVPGGVQPNLQMPTLISWSLRIEQAITPNTSFTIGYVGSHGYHELIGVDANKPVPVICPASPCPADYPANFPGRRWRARRFRLARTTFRQERPRRIPTLANTWTWFSDGTSSYNALEVDLNHRFSHDLSLRANYTWSKALDDGDSLNQTTAGNAPGLVANPYDLRADWGPATFDVRNLASIGLVYALPFGNGKMYANHLGGVGNTVIGGWSVTSIVTGAERVPVHAAAELQPVEQRRHTQSSPAVHESELHRQRDHRQSPAEWFNPAAFLQPPPNSGFYGNLGRDTLTGPGLFDLGFLGGKDTADASG